MKKKYIYSISILLLFIIIGLYFYITNLIEKYNDEAYSRGVDSAFEIIVKQAKNKNCDTINIKNDFEEIKLINVECTKK